MKIVVLTWASRDTDVQEILAKRFQLKHLLSIAPRLKLKLLLEPKIFIKESNLTNDHLD